MTGLAINFAAGKTFFTVLNDKTDIQGQDAALERFKNTSFGYLLGAGVLGITTGFFGFFFNVIPVILNKKLFCFPYFLNYNDHQIYYIYF